MRTKAQEELGDLHPDLTTDGEMDNWIQMEQENKQVQAQLEKMHLDAELTMAICQYEDKEKARRHEEKMVEMRLQAPSTQVNGVPYRRGNGWKRNGTHLCSYSGPSCK